MLKADCQLKIKKSIVLGTYMTGKANNGNDYDISLCILEMCVQWEAF